MSSPGAIYESRLKHCEQASDRLARRQRRLTRARRVLFGIIVALGILAEKERTLPYLLAGPALLLGLADLGRTHTRRQRDRLDRLTEYYAWRLDCLAGRWAGRGRTGEQFADTDHAYAGDLDLFGRGGLFELLAVTQSPVGEETLAGWLLAPAGPAEITERQAAAAELRPDLELRERLYLSGSANLANVDLPALRTWLEQPPKSGRGWLRGAVVGTAAGVVATAAGMAFAPAGAAPFVAACLLHLALAGWWRWRYVGEYTAAEQRVLDLADVAEALRPLARNAFRAERLREIQSALDPTPTWSFHLLAWLGRRVRAAPPLAILLYLTSAALWIDHWRAAARALIQKQFWAWGELEALASLATFSAEHPDDPFPEFAADGPLLHAEELGHPLLADEKSVRNDVQLDQTSSVLLVSGSNMSGKSTLLRTVGVNAVLAQAGATVRASRLRMSPLAIGATLRIQDSLQAGRSRFYAELLRIRQVQDLAAGPRTLLFLFDELLHGTNSRDRRTGAEAIVRTLLEANAIGLLTTHDLSLTDIAEHLPRTANVHFADRVEEGELVFDYRMWPGVVGHSNALALMRAVGIRV
ncbi:MAG: MutS-related protein [Gemmataceae bacterium]